MLDYIYAQFCFLNLCRFVNFVSSRCWTRATWERRGRWRKKSRRSRWQNGGKGIRIHLNIIIIGINNNLSNRYDRDKSRSSSPKRKEYSREERKNGKKKDRRDRSSSPRDKRKDRRSRSKSPEKKRRRRSSSSSGGERRRSPSPISPSSCPSWVIIIVPTLYIHSLFPVVICLCSP